MITIFHNRIILVALVCIVALSCNSSNNEVTVNTNPYFPLSNNLQLSYKSQLTGDTIDVKVKNIRNANNIEFQFDRFPYIWNLDTSIKVIVKNNGEVNCNFLGEDFIFLPSPNKMISGYNWTSQEWNANVSISDSITIGDVIYKDIYKVSYNLSITYIAELWFAKGVGIVKWGFNRTNPPTAEFEYFELI